MTSSWLQRCCPDCYSPLDIYLFGTEAAVDGSALECQCGASFAYDDVAVLEAEFGEWKFISTYKAIGE